MRHALRRASKVLLITGSVLLLLLSGFLFVSLSCMDCFVPGFEKSDHAKLDIQNIAGALKLYFAKHGRYPTTSEGLQSLVEDRQLEELPIDPWNNFYRYELREGRVEITSFGADGRPGGSGSGEDITLGNLQRHESGRTPSQPPSDSSPSPKVPGTGVHQ